MSLPQTIVHALHDRATQLGNHPALHTKRHGRYRATSWRDYEQRVKHFALGLQSLGVGPGVQVAILSFNREEWLVAYLATIASGGVPVGLYTTSSAEQLEYILRHAEVQVLVVEHAAFLEKVRPLRARLGALRHVVAIDPAGAAGDALSYVEVLSRGLRTSDSGYWDRLNALEPGGLATLIYTSGTTGEPKGVMLSHRNLVWTTHQLCEQMGVGEGDTVMSYLPLSHIAEQVVTVAGPLIAGAEVYFAEAFEKLPDNLREAEPTVFLGVPRVWEKFQARAEQAFAVLPRARAELLRWARRVALRRHSLALAHEKVPTELEAQYLLAQRLVFAPLKHRIGFAKTHLFATSAAPISLETLEFFASIDVVIREVYGQSEVTGPTSVNTRDATKLGAVGRPLLGVEVKIAEDGEVCVRGENVCLGYFKDEAGTAELIDDGGWLHSGDVGELDGQGFLHITGRKKELLVTSGGKKTSPTAIEAQLKQLAPIGTPVVIGDRRNYLVALLPLDPEKVPAFAKAHGFPEDPEQLAALPAFREHLRGRIDAEVNEKLARFETIKEFAVLPRDFSTETGELTPTLKLRRRVIEEKYRAEIEALYRK